MVRSAQSCLRVYGFQFSHAFSQYALYPEIYIRGVHSVCSQADRRSSVCRRPPTAKVYLTPGGGSGKTPTAPRGVPTPTRPALRIWAIYDSKGGYSFFYHVQTYSYLFNFLLFPFFRVHPLGRILTKRAKLLGQEVDKLTSGNYLGCQTMSANIRQHTSFFQSKLVD